MSSDRKFAPRALFVGSVCLFFLAAAASAPAQSPEAAKPSSQTPEASPRYANMPEDAVPYRKFSKPYKEWYLTDDTLGYNGAARERISKEMEDSETVNIGFLGPIQNNPESPYGLAMLHGAQLAMEQANARGGYQTAGAAHPKLYQLKVHYDSAQWGASSTEAIKMVLDEHVVGILGSVDGASTHIMLRESLKLEFPIMDTATTDPTVTETRIPWLIHNFPDDRQQGYALAAAVFKERKLKRIGVLRTQSRYARVGVQKFFDEAKRLGHVPVLEVKFERGDHDFTTQLRMLENAHVDGVVLWGEAPEAALILKQVSALGMKQPLFGPSRLCDAQIIDAAGPAAEGLVTTAALDPSRSDAKWLAFRNDYRAKFSEEPEAYAAYGYDGMNILISAVEKAGLNRGKIMDALREYQGQEYDGVAGRAQFDHTLNNIAPITMARVESGKFVYSPPKGQTASFVAKPYATLDRQSVSYRGPTPATNKEPADGLAVIGILLPLRGAHESEGKALLAAAQLAVETEQSLLPLPDGHRLEIASRDESGPWGQASTEILKSVEEDHAVVLLTTANGNSAHLAEQIANKIGFPILTLASDPTTTQTNVPWVFRLVPSDTDQARAICQQIYARLRLQKVLLIVQMDRDGRIGGAEFEKAARGLGAIPPERLEIVDSAPNLDSIAAAIQSKGPQAIVFWTDAPLAEELLPLIRKTQSAALVLLCSKAAQMGMESDRGNTAPALAQEIQSYGRVFTVVPSNDGQEAARSKFQQLYAAQTGSTPGIAANEVYEAVHLIASALDSAGTNRVALRDYFANAGKFHSASHITPFDPAGNRVQEFAIVELHSTPISASAP